DRIGDVVTVARRTGRIALESVFAGMAMSLAAMVAAGFGLLPAVWGALLQEGIDVAVILNALRALRTPAAAGRLSPADAALAKGFSEEHASMHAQIEEIRATADSLDSLAPDAAIARVRTVYQNMVAEVGPHEEAEQRELYPMLNRLLGGSDATET